MGLFQFSEQVYPKRTEVLSDIICLAHKSSGLFLCTRGKKSSTLAIALKKMFNSKLQLKSRIMLDIIYICILFHKNMQLQIASFHAINSIIKYFFYFIKYFLNSTDARARKNTKLCSKFLSLANTIVRVIFLTYFLLSYFANNHHYYDIFQILQISLFLCPFHQQILQLLSSPPAANVFT